MARNGSQSSNQSWRSQDTVRGPFRGTLRGPPIQIETDRGPQSVFPSFLLYLVCLYLSTFDSRSSPAPSVSDITKKSDHSPAFQIHYSRALVGNHGISLHCEVWRVSKIIMTNGYLPSKLQIRVEGFSGVGCTSPSTLSVQLSQSRIKKSRNDGKVWKLPEGSLCFGDARRWKCPIHLPPPTYGGNCQCVHPTLGK